MNNEQIEQPTDVDQQAGNGQTQGTGTANGAYDAGTAEATNGQEGAVPSTMPGDMPGPLPEEAAGTDVSGDLGEVEGGMGMDAATTDAATMDAAAADAPVDLDTGHVDDTGGGAYAEASPASEQTAGADDVDVAGAGADTGAAEGPGEGATDASDASDASAEPSAEGSAAAAAAGGTDSDEMVVRTARDPRMESVGANASMEDLLRASEQQYRTLKHNDVIEGTIMRVDRDEVLVDIGAKTEGIIPSRELQSLTPEEREALAPGDPILVAVVQPENNEGHALLSLDRARQERSWRDLQRKFEAGEVIQAPVSGHNKGGLLVNIEGVRGFVPSSQISSLPPGEANKQAELSRYHNQVMSLKIIEINRNRNRLILSERQAMQEQRESMRTRLLRELEPSQIRPGTVTSIADFGAFVDIGGADGLIHLSELSWKRVSHPSDVLKVGDRINVYVLSVDPNERKIALSLKRTQPEPWSTITDNYTLGQVVRGTITQLTSFGAFARLEDGIEGLIHVSELAEGRVAHPRSVVQEGQTVELKVIRIDPVKRRIGLSLKRMFEDAAPTPGEPGASGVEGDFEAGAVASQLDDPKPGMEVGTELDPNQPSAPEARQQPLPARQAQFQREPQQRGDRDRDRDKDRDRDRDRGRRDDRGGSGGSQATVDDEPLGAMAQAFATFAQTGGLSLTAEEEQAASNRRQGRETQASTTPEPAQATVDAGTEDTQDTQGTEDTADTADTSGTSDTGTTEEVEPTTVEAALPGTTEPRQPRTPQPRPPPCLTGWPVSRPAQRRRVTVAQPTWRPRPRCLLPPAWRLALTLTLMQAAPTWRPNRSLQT